MSAPKSPESYPAAFSMLVERFRSPDAEPVRQHHPRAADASRVRFTWYSFKKSLAAAGRGDEFNIANGVLVRVIPDEHPGVGAVLEFSLRDNVAWALDLERAMQGVAPSAPTAWPEPTTPPPEALPSSDKVVDEYLGGVMSRNSTQ